MSKGKFETVRKIQWRDTVIGINIKGLDASTAHAELEKIGEKYGGISPGSVVEEASVKKHKLHDVFEWSDVKAGHAYRLWQARQLIKSVRVEYVTVEGVVQTGPAFAYVPSKPNEEEDEPATGSRGRYEPVEVIIAEDDTYDRAVAYARSKLDAAKTSLEELLQLAQMAKRTKDLPKITGAVRHVEAAGKVLGELI